MSWSCAARSAGTSSGAARTAVHCCSSPGDPLRHRAAHSSTVDTRLLLSARSSDEVLYRDELARLAAGDGLAVHQTFTREAPHDWSGFARRVDAEMLRHVGPPPSQSPRILICGPTAFVERAADLLVGLGHDTAAIHAERFGPTGG
jgi:ferredoxin-NADP reductase